MEKMDILEEMQREIVIWRKEDQKERHWREKERRYTKRDKEIQAAQLKMIEDFRELLYKLRQSSHRMHWEEVRSLVWEMKKQ